MRQSCSVEHTVQAGQITWLTPILVYNTVLVHSTVLHDVGPLDYTHFTGLKITPL